MLINILTRCSRPQNLVFNQRVDGKDFTKLDIKEAKPENMKIGGIDIAQFLIHICDYGGALRYNNSYTADGELIRKET